MTHEQYNRAITIQEELEDLYKSKNQLETVKEISKIEVTTINNPGRDYEIYIPDWVEEKLFPTFIAGMKTEVNARIDILEEEFKSL